MELKNFFVQDDQGNKLPGAKCYLYLRGTEIPAAGAVKANGTPLGFPYTADNDGLVQLAAPNGLYDLRVTSPGRDYRIRLQFNDVSESIESAQAAAKRAEVAADHANATGKIYDSTAIGLLPANTVSGQYFSVPSADEKEVLILYRNTGGVAQDTGKRSPSPLALKLLEEAMIRALHARHGTSKNLLTVFTDTGSNNGTTTEQALLRWTAAAQNAGVAIDLTAGVFVAVRLKVTGAGYPASASDAAVFAANSALRLQGFIGGTLSLNQNLVRLPGTDVWYYRSTTTAVACITELKVFATPVPGVTLQFEDGVIQADSGFGLPEIDARNTAIAAARTMAHEELLLSLFREGAEANLLGTTESIGTAIRQLIGNVNQTLTTFSAACIIECDGAYPADGVTYIKAEAFRGVSTLSASVNLKRIGTSKVWYVANIPAGTGPHTSVKISVDVPPGSTTVTVRKAVFVAGGYASPLKLLLDSLQTTVTSAAAAAAVAAAHATAEQTVAAGLSGANLGWPTTALEALSQASKRRVDFVMIGDSNQQMDGKGFDYALRRALGNRFGQYATPVLMGNSFGSNAGATADQASHELAPSSLFYRCVADGAVVAAGTANGVEVRADGHYPLNPSALLRCHIAYSTFASGAGSFRPGVRREEAPWSLLKLSPVITTSTGVEGYVRSYFDLEAGARDGQALSFKWVIPQQTALTGPFLSYFMRIEDVLKTAGVSAHTLYAAGGQSLWDMSTQLNAYTVKQLSNYFAEVRRLQVEKGLKPIVVVYVNSGLNDRNETSVPSLGWRASTAADSPTAYLDNLETIAKRFSDVWQVNGWDERELFFLVIPSHPVSTPDDSELKSYRKVAWSFAGVRARVSIVDFENLTSSDEMLANGWYKSSGADRNHLELSGYEALSAQVVSLIP